jgi:hypothetical protein
MTEREPQTRLRNLLRGAVATRAVAIVADLGVADALAARPRPVADLARELCADADVLQRLLRALASDGVFTEVEPGVFRNTDVSDILRDDAWAAFAHLFGGVWHRTAAELEPSGDPSFPATFGADFWTWLAARPSERAAFDRVMVEGTDRRAERPAALDWRGDETVVDVGGGNGSLLVELLRRRPGLRGIVFDLPETTRDEASLGEGCSFVAGSFFDFVPSGDVYVLSTVLHDWDDAAAARLLGTIRTCAPAGARLLLLEAVVPNGNDPHGAKWLDLLLLALFGGRERDGAQWHELLEAGGFEPVRIEDGLIEARCL